MPAFGGMTPFPIRFGGGKPNVEIILDSLNADRGTAYDTADRTTTVYIENMAIARAIAAAWGTNARLGNIGVPSAMSETILSRWEKILALSPSATDTEATRRDRVADLFARVGQASINGYFATILTDALGSAFVAIEHVPYSSAVIYVPDGSYPWGTVNSLSPWSSTVAHVIVRLQKPSGWTEGDFYNAAAKVVPLLEPALPAWATVSWYRATESTPVSIAGGPSAAGVYCDTPHTLDNNILAH